MKLFTQPLWLGLLLSLLTPNLLLAEGTRELLAGDCANTGYIQIWDNNDLQRSFATFNGPPETRLHVRIADTQEVIYLGYRILSGGNNVYVRIMAPDGSIALPATQVSALGDSGYIDACSEALVGPSQLSGPAGYLALQLPISSLANPQTGDYWIEFNGGSATATNVSSRRFRYFDVTVADTLGGAAVPGRLWSRAWDFTTNGGNNPFEPTLFAYSKDSVVTSFDFNGMQPFGFVVSCNSFGASDVGPLDQRRQSDYRQNILNDGGQPGVPEYPIFLNNPDSLEFPTGEVGALTGFSVNSCNRYSYCIDMEVTRAGDLEINIDLPPGYQDRNLLQTVPGPCSAANPCQVCVPWDGLDADGQAVDDQVTVTITGRYLTGLTHLPLTDVEDHPNGYSVDVVRPTVDGGGAPLQPPRVYWDDSNLNDPLNSLDGTQNLTGCNGNCHQWRNRGNDNSNPEVINTWWFVNEQSNTLTFTTDYGQEVLVNRMNTTSLCNGASFFDIQVQYPKSMPTQNVTYTFTASDPSKFSLDTVEVDSSQSGAFNFLNIRYNVNAPVLSSDQFTLESNGFGGIYPYCYYTTSGNCTPAPLSANELAFDLEQRLSAIDLHWRSSSSIPQGQAAGYRVQRLQGEQTRNLGALQHHNQQQQYTWRDRPETPGAYAYRIQVLDNEGAVVSSSAWREVYWNPMEQARWEVLAEDALLLRLPEAFRRAPVQLQVVDPVGASLVQHTESTSRGLQVRLKAGASPVAFCKALVDGQWVTRKLLLP